MAGTPEGAAKMNQKLLERFGSEEALRAWRAESALKAQKAWAANGRKPRGFAHPDSDPHESGRKGGTISRRGKAQ